MSVLRTEDREKAKTTPLVSVVMPAYNAERFIEEAIRSVQSQTMEDWELIVVDDCSTDSTVEIAKRLKASDHRILLIEMKENRGVASARNAGLDLARGSYVALLDSDDVWRNCKLEKQIAKMRSACADIVNCSYDYIDAEGRSKGLTYHVPETTTFDFLLKENTIGCSMALLSSEVAESYRFDSGYFHEDYVFWLRLLKEGKIVSGCTEVLVSCRHSRGSRSFDKWKSARNRWVVYRNYLKFSAIKSALYFAYYVVAGIRKYS